MYGAECPGSKLRIQVFNITALFSGADYHVGSQPQYVTPPNQSGNQGPTMRSGMQPTGPPNQASTPPNSEIKVPQIQQPINLVSLFFNY